jgi:hypothetical protein
MVFNVSFMANARPSFDMEAAVATLDMALKADVGPDNLARHWLFPDPEDLDRFFSTSTVDQDFQDEDWVDKGLNLEQRVGALVAIPTFLNVSVQLAASSIALHQSPVPYLISGPPGTGKTRFVFKMVVNFISHWQCRTVVETVLQILRIQPESCILVCAPSNPATDTLVMRLRTFLPPHEMLRLNDQNRTFAEVPMNISQYCCMYMSCRP